MRPQPGFVIKTHFIKEQANRLDAEPPSPYLLAHHSPAPQNEKGEKVFVNVVTSEKIAEPVPFLAAAESLSSSHSGHCAGLRFEWHGRLRVRWTGALIGVFLWQLDPSVSKRIKQAPR